MTFEFSSKSVSKLVWLKPFVPSNIGSNKQILALITKTLGRGSDFVCRDDIVQADVIQTFLSEQVSEEVQIKGRTARQDDFASYRKILLDSNLKNFQKIR